MRQAFVVVLVAAVLVPVAARAAAPSLSMAQRSPLVLTGAGFQARERVTVTLLTGIGARRVQVVAVGGRFRVEFRVPARGCGAAWAARAVGSAGSKARVVFGDAAACIPPPRD